MRTHKFFGTKKPAQAMVEFAIALPVLLLLLYGILEAGRLLFLYSTVVTASRQAARYGTTTGDGGGTTPIYGAPRPVVPRYRDCAGIRGAADRVGYLSRDGFDNIQLAYDSGPGTSANNFCTGGSDTEISGIPTIPELQGNSTRLVVTVTEEFVPIVPQIVPFIQRNITATSARTILYSVPIVVEQAPVIVPQSPTTTTITSDNPDPSQMNEDVTVTVTVVDQDDATNTPQGTVEISGSDTPCTITLSGGSGSCVVSFAAAGDYTLVAIYTPTDDDHLPSDDTEPHKVELAKTITTIISVLPEPSIRNQDVTVAVTVTGGITTPTGTVTIDAGGNNNCTVTLAGGAGSCVLNFNNTGWKTIYATYNGDSTHKTSTSAPVAHQVLELTPTPSPTATRTPIPSPTVSPTATLSPTPVPTRVASCTGITHGSLSISGNQMTMTINNPFAFNLVMKDTTVTWNDDKGHQSGSDKTLRLQSVLVNGVEIWNGDVGNQSTYTVGATPVFKPGTNTITFTFHQEYDNLDTTERILINWLTPGCEGNAVDSRS